MSIIWSEKEKNEKNNKKPQRLDLSYHQPLYLLSTLIGLCPPTCLSDYYVKDSLLHRIYSLGLALFIFIISSYSLYGRIKYTYSFFLQTIKVTDTIKQILLTSTVCYAILNSAVRGHRIYGEYCEKLIKMDMYLKTKRNLKNDKIHYRLTLIITTFIMILLFVGDYVAWKQSIGDYYIYYLLRLFESTIFVILSLQIIENFRAIYVRFCVLNEKLMESFMHWFNNFNVRVVSRNEMSSQVTLKTLTIDTGVYLPLKLLTELHDSLCDCVDLMNKFFGLCLFLMMSHLIVHTVAALNTMIVYAMGLDLAVSKDYDWLLIIVNAVWTLYYWVCTSFQIRVFYL